MCLLLLLHFILALILTNASVARRQIGYDETPASKNIFYITQLFLQKLVIREIGTQTL